MLLFYCILLLKTEECTRKSDGRVMVMEGGGTEDRGKACESG